jgi:hypothetical protein
MVLQFTALVVLVAAMTAIAFALKSGGPMFIAGAAFSAAIFHIGYRAKHGRWFSLID